MGEGEESIGRHVESDRDIVLERTCLNSFIAGTGDIRCIWFRLYLTGIQSLLTGFTYNVNQLRMLRTMGSILLVMK